MDGGREWGAADWRAAGRRRLRARGAPAALRSMRAGWHRSARRWPPPAAPPRRPAGSGFVCSHTRSRPSPGGVSVFLTHLMRNRTGYTDASNCESSCCCTHTAQSRGGGGGGISVSNFLMHLMCASRWAALARPTAGPVVAAARPCLLKAVSHGVRVGGRSCGRPGGAHRARRVALRCD